MRLNLPVLLDGLLDGSGVLDALLGPLATVLAIRADPNVGVTPEMVAEDAEQALATDPGASSAKDRALPDRT